MINRPKGFNEIIRVFGDPLPYVQNKQAWEDKILITKKLPHGIPYAGDPKITITKIRTHFLLIDEFIDAIEECLDLGVPPDRLVYGGIYSYRLKRGMSKISTHTFGIAIDIDPARNPLGKQWAGCKSDMMHPLIIKNFEKRGFVWGGRWKRPDPMHFQFATGY